MKFVMLHGFLGRPADFHPLKKEISTHFPQAEFWVPDLFEVNSRLNPNFDFSRWTEAFLEELDRRFGKGDVCLVGYSMGGRLALHAALRQPRRFLKLILLSTNPGWMDGSSQQRRLWEKQWSEKLFNLSEAEFLDQWNAQSVFAGSEERGEWHFDSAGRHLLAKALSEWSLLNHQFTWQDLGKLTAHTQWWFGERDQKFLSVKEALSGHNVPGTQHVVEGAGHRLIFDNPGAIAEHLRRSIEGERS